MHCFGIAALITVLWTIFGYSLAFTASNPFIGNLSKSFLSGVTVDSLSGTIPELLFFVFQMTFAIITPGLFVGAFAERMKFSAVLWFSGAVVRFGLSAHHAHGLGRGRLLWCNGRF